MTLKELIEDLEVKMLANASVASVAYGELEAIDNNKDGVLYPRAYMHWLDASYDSVRLRIYAVDEVLNDHSNRLDVQSRMLTLAKELRQQLISDASLQFDDITDYEPTRLQGSDQHEGVYFEVEIRLIEEINIC